METIDYRVQDQCGRSAVPDVGRMVMFVKCDRTSRPRVKLRGDWVQRVKYPKCVLPLLFGDVGNVNHVYFCYLIRKLLLASITRPPRFILIFAAILGFMLTLCRYLAGLLEDPAIPVSVGCWFVLSAVDSTWAVQESIKLARSVLVPFKGLSFLSGLRSGEPRIDRSVFRIASTIFIPVLIFVALGFSIGVACFRGACLTIVSTASEPSVFSRPKASHQ